MSKSTDSDKNAEFLNRRPPEGYLEGWGEFLAKQPDQQESRFETVVIFRLSQEQLALPCRVVEAVLTERPIRTVPHRSGGVLRGLVNLDGRLEVCLSLEHLLGITTDQLPTGETERLLVVRSEQRRYAFAVPTVLGLRALYKDDVKLGSEGLGSPGLLEYVRGTFANEGGVAALLDSDRVFTGVTGSLQR